MPIKRYIEQTDRGRYYFFDDFGGAAHDNVTWLAIGNVGGGIAKIAAIGGQVRITVGGTTGDEYSIAQDARRNFSATGPCDITWRVKPEDITYLAAQFGLANGITDNVLLLADSTVGVNWLAQCRSGGVTTQVDTGYRVDAAVWVTLKVVVAAASVRFFINGTLVATILTNIPTGDLGPIAYLYRNAGGSGTRSVLADWVEAFGPRP